MPAGRPIEYKPEFVERVKEYLATRVDETIQVIAGESEKFTSYRDKKVVKMPTMEGLAVYLGIAKDTLYRWEKEYPEFSDIINVLKAQQVERLIDNGLSGDYNPVIAKVLLTKHGYSEKNELELSGGVDIGKKPSWFDDTVE